MVTTTIMLANGRYTSKKPDLSFMLANELRFSGNNTYVFTGENGAGKTTFVERVILPALRSERRSALYVGADLQNAQPAMVAFLALRQALRRRGDLYDDSSNSTDGLVRAVSELAVGRSDLEAVVIDEYKNSMLPLIVDAVARRRFLLLVTQDYRHVRDLLRPHSTDVSIFEFVRDANNVVIREHVA